MADSLTFNMNAQVNWVHTTSPDSLSSLEDSASLIFLGSLANGTGDNQADCLFHAQVTIAASGTLSLDLTALTYVLFGSTITVTLGHLKGLFISNANALDTDIVVVGNAGSDPFVGPMGGTDPTESIAGNGVLVWARFGAGWAVSGGAKNLLITNSGANPIVLNIALVGTST